MTNRVDCPECGTTFDAVEVSLIGKCPNPECETDFNSMLEEPENDPDEAGPYHQFEVEQ